MVCRGVGVDMLAPIYMCVCGMYNLEMLQFDLLNLNPLSCMTKFVELGSLS